MIDKSVLFPLLFLLLGVFTFPHNASAQSVDDYGQLPKFRSLAISPNGQYFSYIQRGNGNDIFAVNNAKTQELIFAANVNKFKARSTYFVTNKHVVLQGSDTTRTPGYFGRREQSGALVYNLETDKTKVLLKNTKGIHPAQTGLGKIVGLNTEDEVVYMPAYNNDSVPAYNLYKVSLNGGRGRVHAKGNSDTIDWFVDKQGAVLAREEYDMDENRHIIRSKISGKWTTIYDTETPLFVISVQGVGADGESLLYIKADDDRKALYSMSLADGSVSAPLFSLDDADVDDLVMDINRQLLAVVFSGFKPGYDFVDPEINQLFDRLSLNFPSSSVHWASWTEDRKSIILRVSGADAAGSYYLLDRHKMQLSILASEYKVPAIAAVKAIRYRARDDLEIPAVLTLPPGDQEHKNLPLITLPHGGPAAYDQISFDWMAQYFAMKGYAVLQPNFRGSTGFGFAFRNAGHGRWGREMQTDVSDGITALVEAGYVDPERVCIVGASYGGYSALAGGAFSPELYRCIVAVAGVSDLPKMLRSEKSKYGKNHWVVSYWEQVIGDSKSEIDKLRAISPVNFAADFQAPVLLIHGRDDTVVPIKQSKLMYKALKKADKPVTFNTLKGEDHWLSTSAMRLEMLTAISDFLDMHNPVDFVSEEKKINVAD